MSRRLRIVLAVLLTVMGVAGVVPAAFSSAAASDSFSKSETITRSNLVAGVSTITDTRTFKVNVDQTQNLRDRQEIDVSWSGAHPTGALAGDVNSESAAEQEYPVMIVECRGAPNELTPETCFTHTPKERVFSDVGFPAYRIDRYATTADKGGAVGVPNPAPSSCAPYLGGVQHWVPFIGADGKKYPIGPLGCAGMPADMLNTDSSLQPADTTYGQTDASGNGSAKFVISTAQTLASLGCSETVTCSLVIVPIMGISCDPSIIGSDPSNATYAKALKDCSSKGNYQAGEFSSSAGSEALAVSGQLWWSESNWRNRVAVQLGFAQASNVCESASSADVTYIYGSEMLAPATEQWLPYFCLNSKLFNLRHVLTPEPEAKNLVSAASIDAAFVGRPPTDAFTRPVVSSPTAFSGFVIGFVVDDAKGVPMTQLRLTPRLLAKLMTESYPSSSLVSAGYPALAKNPLDMALDPEFLALNPKPSLGATSGPASVLFNLSSDSDIVYALTSYINADPEARAWLDGTPDPWGMKVNPNYKGIKLPVESWPLLDSTEPQALYAGGANPCLAAAPVPYLPLVAAPVSQLSILTLNLQYGIANSQINCDNAGAPNQKLTAVGREIPGNRFILGVAGYADALRYQINQASLQTYADQTTSGTKFTSAAGRTFVAPSPDSLKASVNLFKPNSATGSWLYDYAALDSSSGAAAYPGAMLLSTDVPTSGLNARTASNYGKFLQFTTSTGQETGFGNGQLPPGFLPITKANGFASELAYASCAAAAVSAQTGKVPPLDGACPGVGGSTGGAGGSAAGGNSPTPAAVPSGGASSSSSTSSPNNPTPTALSTPTEAASAPVVAIAPTGQTAKLDAGFGGSALLVLGLVALAGGVGATASVLRIRPADE